MLANGSTQMPIRLAAAGAAERVGPGVAVVALGPDLAAAVALDQLRRDAYAPARFADAALEHVADLELSRDLRHVEALALERERRVARHDEQRRDLVQVGDDVFADAVAEVLLFRIAAHVGERQHADPDPAGGHRRGGTCRPGSCGRGAGSALADDHHAQRAQQRLERRALGILAPTVEVGRVDRAHVHR